MKKVLKWLGIIILLIVVLIFSGIGYINMALPNVGEAPILEIEQTPERIARGKYLAYSVSLCMDCHSTRDWSKFAGPMVAGTDGIGGEVFDKTMGFPGNFYSKNITPAGIGSWTDGELYRVITTGVRNDGEPIFPVMPYHYYGRMANEDIYSIIAFIRTLPPQESVVPEREVDFPISLIMRTMPKKGEPGILPEPSDGLAYGAYLTNAAGCRECHTPADEQHNLLPGMDFSGGQVFDLPGGTLVSANITPHNTGLGFWSQEQFIAKFKAYQDSAYQAPQVDMTKDYNTIMPWMMYSTMTEQDLAAIYQYLKSVKPIENEPVKWTAR